MDVLESMVSSSSPATEWLKRGFVARSSEVTLFKSDRYFSIRSSSSFFRHPSRSSCSSVSLLLIGGSDMTSVWLKYCSSWTSGKGQHLRATSADQARIEKSKRSHGPTSLCVMIVIVSGFSWPPLATDLCFSLTPTLPQCSRFDFVHCDWIDYEVTLHALIWSTHSHSVSDSLAP